MDVLCPSNKFYKSILNSGQDRWFYWQFWAQIPLKVSGRNGLPNVQKPTKIIKLNNGMCIIHFNRLIFITNRPRMALITSFNQI